ncbi:unnamed protein product [Trichobilharzia regenti]|nr:unnamed protein product [Trichobilharzia regenti]
MGCHRLNSIVEKPFVWNPSCYLGSWTVRYEDALIAAVRSEVNSSETNASGNNEALRSELNQLCDKLEVVKTERSQIMERLKVIDFPPDFAKKLLTHYREHGEIIDLDMPSDVLNEKMASVRESVRENLNKQDNLLSQLQVKADMFYGGSDSSTSKNKGLLTMLNLAADEYSALQEAVRDAMKFYAELTEICLNTQSKIVMLSNLEQRSQLPLTIFMVNILSTTGLYT